MKKMELRRVPYGMAFQAFGDEFVALDYINGGVLAIRRDIWKNAAFDDNGVNDLRGASITDGLAEYLRKMLDGGADTGDILEMSIDLKAVDGTREYGRYDNHVGLLTLEQYGKYQHIIPDVDGPWWLATPWRTPGEKFGGATRALFVFTDGGWSGNYCSYAGCAIRPALLFSSSLLVSIEDEEAADEASLYSGYVDYVREWMDEDPDVGSSPMSYEEWKKDGGQEEA